MSKSKSKMSKTDILRNSSYVVAPEEGQHITREKVRMLMPRGTNKEVVDEAVRLIRDISVGVDLPKEILEEDVMSNLHLLRTIPGANVRSMVNAVKFCNLKRYMSNKEAWSIVFPERYDKLVLEKRQIDNHVAEFNSTKLVIAIDKEQLIAAHIKYYPLFDAAVKELAKVGLYNNAGVDAKGDKMTVSPLVKVQALKELANLTKQPEINQLDVKISPSEDAMSVQEQINSQLAALVSKQHLDLEAGADIVDVQTLGIDLEHLAEPE